MGNTAPNPVLSTIKYFRRNMKPIYGIKAALPCLQKLDRIPINRNARDGPVPQIPGGSYLETERFMTLQAKCGICLKHAQSV